MADEQKKSLPTEWLAMLCSEEERLVAKQIMEDWTHGSHKCKASKDVYLP